MLGESLDKQVQAYLMELGRVGGVVNMANARGIVRKKDSNLPFKLEQSKFVN